MNEPVFCLERRFAFSIFSTFNPQFFFFFFSSCHAAVRNTFSQLFDNYPYHAYFWPELVLNLCAVFFQGKKKEFYKMNARPGKIIFYTQQCRDPGATTSVLVIVIEVDAELIKAV